METLEVGSALVALCREGKYLEAIDTYYADDIVSIEGATQGDQPARLEGVAAIRGKNEWWEANHEVHEVTVEGPFCAEGYDTFGLHFFLDITPKGGERLKMSEVALYRVSGGKIVEERFLYNMAG
ncbi:MAG: SnoaL-like domain-containing protein [Acidobacteriota bacterium]